MKKKRLGRFMLVLAAFLALAACGAETDGTEDDNTEEAAPAGGSEMEALILEKLEDHHGTDEIFEETRTREEWDEVLDRMIAYGARIDEEEKEAIIEYLLSR